MPSRPAGASNIANDFYPDFDDTVDGPRWRWRNQFGRLGGRCARAGLHLVADQAGSSPASRPTGHVATIDRVRPGHRAAPNAGCWRMQNRDGGWGAFDRDNDREFLCYVPFADHNAMIDPSTPDLAGRVLEMLGQLGRRVGDPAVDRAVAYIRGDAGGRRQLVRPLGRELHLWHLAGARRPGRRRRAGRRSRRSSAAPTGCSRYQQPSGGWGESPDSYADPHLRGQGPVTASQTAWALLGLMAAGRHDHPAVARGVRWLVERSNATMAPGRNASSPAPAFPRSFTSAITCIRFTSR